MRQQTQTPTTQQRTEYLPGTTVFAKLKGYPWWPARIEAEGTVPAKVLKQKARSKGALYTVFFYGSRDYGFFGPDAIRPFDSQNVENDLKNKKFKTKDLELAIRQALNPSLLTELEEEEEEEAEEEEAEEEEEEEQKVVAKGKKKVGTTATKKSNVKKEPVTKTTTAVKRRSRKLTTTPVTNGEGREGGMEEDEWDNDEKVVSETAVSENNDRKKRRKSMSIEKEDNGSPITNNHVLDNKEDIKKSPEYKKVYHIRHRLQRLVYNKKEGEIPKEDYGKILQVVKEIEEAPMTYNLLKDTKIGKVVKAACVYPFEDETMIKDRCQQLMRNWKNIFIVPQTSGGGSEDAHMQDI